MKTFALVEKGHDIKEFENWLDQHFGNAQLLTKQHNFSDTIWHEYNEDEYGISKKWLSRLAEAVQQGHKNTIDNIYCFVGRDNWEGESILGWHLGNSYSGARVCQVKMRHEYHMTAKHEWMHAVWSYVYMHLGIDLESVLGASEDGVVHGNAKGFEEYKYEQPIEKIRPVYQKAVGEDLSDEYRSLSQTAIRKAQKLIRQLRRQNNNNKLHGEQR